MKRHTSDFILKADSISEAIEIFVNDLKSRGDVPKDFKLSDFARNDLKEFIHNIVEYDYKDCTSQDFIDIIFSDLVYGFCLGYAHGREHRSLK